MRDVTVCIAWRPQPDRLDAFARATSWWESHGFPIVTGDSDHEVFNLAAARNAAVLKADTELIIVADADTIPEIDAIEHALQFAAAGVVWPFETYRYLGEHTPAPTDVATSDFERDFPASVGGIFVTTKTIYWDLGGQDEGFVSWGWEDTAFRNVARTLSQVFRVPGTVYAYGHDADRDLSDGNPGYWRMQLYVWADGTPAVMRELIRKC